MNISSTLRSASPSFECWQISGTPLLFLSGSQRWNHRRCLQVERLTALAVLIPHDPKSNYSEARCTQLYNTKPVNYHPSFSRAVYSTYRRIPSAKSQLPKSPPLHHHNNVRHRRKTTGSRLLRHNPRLPHPPPNVRPLGIRTHSTPKSIKCENVRQTTILSLSLCLH